MSHLDLREKPDVVVIGAGVIGMGIAWELGKRGKRTLVLERDAPGAGASAVAAGMLAPVSEADLERPALIQYGLLNVGLYPAYVAELEADSGVALDYRADGTLFAALSRDDEGELEHVAQAQRRMDLVARWLTAEETWDLEPRLSDRVLSGLMVEGDHRIDARRQVEALAKAVVRRGGTLFHPATVDEIVIADSSAGHAARRPGRVSGVRGTRRGEPFAIECDTVVLAAGAWCSTGIAAPLAGLGARPVRGQSVLLRGPETLHRSIRHPQCYMVPHAGGDIVVGGTMEEMGFNAIATAEAVQRLTRWAIEICPALAEHQVAALPVGLRPAVRDNLPAIGLAGADGLYVATGHLRNGILLAPATGQHLAEWIVSGRRPEELIPFDPQRLLDTARKTA